MSSVLRDLLPDNLTTEENRIIVKRQFGSIIGVADSIEKARTPHPAKNLNEFYTLVKNVIEDYERRENTIEDGKVFFASEDADIPKDKNIAIVFSLVKSMPGGFGRGAPFESEITNQKPILREVIDDPENPGYQRAILGYWHDNEVQLTILARTNKAANEKALWFENIMQEYSWYFALQGVARVIFMKREQDYIVETTGNKMYGRPLHFFVKTETLRTVSEKKIEQILINASLSTGVTT